MRNKNHARKHPWSEKKDMCSEDGSEAQTLVFVKLELRILIEEGLNALLYQANIVL